MRQWRPFANDNDNANDTTKARHRPTALRMQDK